jgi:hypothetical protein
MATNEASYVDRIAKEIAADIGALHRAKFGGFALSSERPGEVPTAMRLPCLASWTTEFNRT